MARSIPRIAGLTLCAAAIAHLTIAFGFAADTETAGAAIAIVDFNYVDTSGEVRDQRAEHEVRLSVFMNTLRDDLAASGIFRVIVPACRPDPCSRSSRSELFPCSRSGFCTGRRDSQDEHACAVGEGRSDRPQERPDRARQAFHLPRGHRSSLEAR
jgi:hypothetical protein